MIKNLKTTKVTKEKSRKKIVKRKKSHFSRTFSFFELLIRLKLLCLLWFESNLKYSF